MTRHNMTKEDEVGLVELKCAKKLIKQAGTVVNEYLDTMNYNSTDFHKKHYPNPNNPNQVACFISYCLRTNISRGNILCIVEYTKYSSDSQSCSNFHNFHPQFFFRIYQPHLYQA